MSRPVASSGLRSGLPARSGWVGVFGPGGGVAGVDGRPRDQVGERRRAVAARQAEADLVATRRVGLPHRMQQRRPDAAAVRRLGLPGLGAAARVDALPAQPGMRGPVRREAPLVLGVEPRSGSRTRPVRRRSRPAAGHRSAAWSAFRCGGCSRPRSRPPGCARRRPAPGSASRCALAVRSRVAALSSSVRVCAPPVLLAPAGCAWPSATRRRRHAPPGARRRRGAGSTAGSGAPARNCRRRRWCCGRRRVVGANPPVHGADALLEHARAPRVAAAVDRGAGSPSGCGPPRRSATAGGRWRAVPGGARAPCRRRAGRASTRPSARSRSVVVVTRVAGAVLP